jgi:hypothetical protein
MQNNLTASELRIGNLILRNGFLPQDKNNFNQIVTSHNDITACVVSPSSFKPIPLTEEWLKKFGIEYEKDIDYFFISFELADGDIELISNTDELGTYWFSHQISTLKIRYCHQLQNLYFCLSGEELTIKENE